MRRWVCVVAVLLLLGSAYADLQNVQVGGQIEFRGRWYHNAFESGAGPMRPAPVLRIPSTWLPGRTTGQPGGVLGLFRYDDHGNDWAFCEIATSLNVCADFTDNVSAFIEFYDFAFWGQDFRSNYLTGVDGRAVTSDDLEVLQSYIELNEVLGAPLRLRIGRQVLQFGRDLNCWLLAGKTTPTQRFSYDGVRATYTGIEDLTLDAWWMKLAENSPLEQDGDTDFYGLYGTYKVSDALKLSGYWLFLRDSQAVNDTNGTLEMEWLEDLVGLDDYPVTAFHTVGLNANGKINRFDYNVDVSYQFGDAGTYGALFQKPLFGIAYGDDDAEYDHWGMQATIGYTTDTAWSIRPFLSAVWFEGEDNRDVSFWEWLNPFDVGKASVSFNRLFSDMNFCPVINDNADMTNYYQVQGGVTMSPTEKLFVLLRAYNTWVDEPFDWPAYIEVGRRWAPGGRLPIAPGLSFWTEESDDNLGFSLDMVLKYQYSPDLTFMFYYGHLFAGDGLRDGAYVNSYGNMFNGGIDDDDADYVFWWAILKF